ncbi:unnamed protein product, partial [Musa textilis]
ASEALHLEVTVDGNSVLHIAAKLGHVELAKALCLEQPCLMKLSNSKGDTPLHCAAAAGHVAIVELFVAHIFLFENPVFSEVYGVPWMTNDAGNTALHEATRNGHRAVVEALMSAAPDLADVENNTGVRALRGSREGIGGDCQGIAQVSDCLGRRTSRPDSTACSCTSELWYVPSLGY